MKTACFLLLVVLWLLPVHARQQVARPEIDVTTPKATPAFKHLTVEDGLVENTPRAMVQDHEGFLWIVTINGLQRYDGCSYKTIKPVDGDNLSVAGSLNTGLFEYSRHNLWVMGNDGLSRFDRASETFEHFVHDSDDPNSLLGRNAYSMTDNGPGIPPDVRAKIFEPFFTTKPTGSGTGLGLSLSHDIVTQGHGGTLTVESTPGAGAAFVVTLPLRNVPSSPIPNNP
ncbi:MAG: hypothetical protein D6746_11085 [Bacteroidetes bacterium]|nr:MAG: hypothetical protein D6746_11085 [Bacteroidota bacterium]